MKHINAAFNRAFKGAINSMTPTLIERGASGAYYYELAKGDGIFGGTMYGVSVITPKGEKTSLSTCFDTESHARGFISEL